MISIESCQADASTSSHPLISNRPAKRVYSIAAADPVATPSMSDLGIPPSSEELGYDTAEMPTGSFTGTNASGRESYGDDD